MLQTEASCARDWNISDIPADLSSTRVVKKTVTKVNHKRKIYVKIALALFSYALVLVFLCIKSATLGYQIDGLQKDIRNLDTANHRLEYTIAEKSSLDRVEKRAVANLGMYKPDESRSITMEVKTEPIKLASAAGSVMNDKTVSQKILDKVFSSLSHLAQKN